MSKTIDNIKSGNYEVVDNQGVSVTGHFTQCLEKEFADLEAKLAEKDRKNLLLYSMLYTTLEKQDTENVSSRIAQMTGETLDKQSEWFKTNRVCDKLQRYIKQVIKEKEELTQQLAITEKALDYAIFELDFAKNHSQSTNSETFIRIDKLRNKILNKAKERCKND